MNGDGYKEVYFDKYCKSCEHEDLKTRATIVYLRL